jgi:GT2 family glycosyltransferase
MRSVPKISVLISTYNHRRYVAKKLAEIARQTAFAEAEFIFIETASPERERDLLEPFCRENPNCRLLAIDRRTTLYEAWNLGWQAAQAPLLCYSNMDDSMHPALLATVIQTFEKNPAIDLCAPLIAYQRENATVDRFDPFAMKGRRLSLRPGPFTAWRASLESEIGRFDPAFHIAGDKDFWSRALAKRRPFKVIWKTLYLFTTSPTQLSKQPGERAKRDRPLQQLKPYPAVWPRRYKRAVQLLQPLWKRFPQGFLPPE